MAASSPMTRKRTATRRRATRRSRWLVSATLGLLAAAATTQSLPLQAQDEWVHWGRDAGNQRHSPLTQIDVDNVATLVPAWRYEMTKAGVPSRPAQSTPLMVDGVLYLSFPYYRVVALEPETGEEIWEYTAPGDWNSPEHQLHWTGGSMRGLAYWEGDDTIPPQIVFGTEEGELISLNAATGLPNPRFGNDGFVDMKTPDVMNGFPNMHYGISSGVAIWKHLVFTGVHNADETGSKGPAGDTRAWDLRTGELVWTFHTVPHPGEFGNETWLDDSWLNVSGANTWSFFTIDEERGILYMPLGSAHNDFYGHDRPGDNLFSDSIVAVDALTGERLWHFQAVHHDLWDLDMPAPPILFDVERDGETIPAVGVMTKYPVLFIFNRVTGEPIYEIEERPVPAGNMPGEYYSPTQPFPVKPPPIGRIDFTMDEIATVTPEHTAACRELLMQYDGGRNRGPYTPPSEEGALVFPSTGGGTEFTGGTFDPSLGYYIINYADTGHISQLVKVEDDGPWTALVAGGYVNSGGGRSRSPRLCGSSRVAPDLLARRHPAVRQRLALLAAALVEAGRRGRQQRRDRLDDPVRHRGRRTARREHGRPELSEGRADLYRQRPALHRRGHRSTVPRLRDEDRARAVEFRDRAVDQRLQPHHLPGR